MIAVHLRDVGHLPALWGVQTPTDFDDSIGRLVCTNCGHVANDSFIVSEISFGETMVAVGLPEFKGVMLPKDKFMLVGVVGEGSGVGMVLRAKNC